MSFIEAAKETIEMHANQLRYSAGSIGIHGSVDATNASDLLNHVADTMIHEIELSKQKQRNNEFWQRYIDRAQAYLNDLVEEIADADGSPSECIHLAGHVEQEMSELVDEIKSNANNN